MARLYNGGMTTGTLQFVDLAAPGAVALSDVAVRLNPSDDVAVAKTHLQAGTALTFDGARVEVRQFVATGHKIALRDAAESAPLRRYGQVIGFATRPIRAGDHVHVHNLAAHAFDRDYAFGADAAPYDVLPLERRRTFQGIARPDGRVGTRNYVAVISSVNCSAHTVREIAHHFTPERLAAFPNVDGVIPIAHGWGCATRIGGENDVLLQRTLAGIARHPNVAGYVLVGLGCETNQIEVLIDNQALRLEDGGRPLRMTIQDTGGVRKTIASGVAAVESLLPGADAARRAPQPISELILALQCGGSDGWSGVTANPLLGLVADAVVRSGGRAVLSETPEIYGAEHLLTRRAASREVGEKLVRLIRWWESYAAKMNLDIDNNPSPGNKAGGLTTIYEKSLGAVAKGGSMPLMDVFGYAEQVTTRGFTFMDTPGYDPVSATGQSAGGCNVMLFTTGRGSVFGFKPTPSIKVCTNTATYNALSEDMDFNAGRVLDGALMDDVAGELLELVIDVASGRKTESEELGIGENEFQPWHVGGTL